MKGAMDLLAENINAMIETDLAADGFIYLKETEYPEEYQELIRAVNRMTEAQNTRIRLERHNFEVLSNLVCSGTWSVEFNRKGEIRGVCWSRAFRNMLGFTDEKDFPDVLESWADRLHPEDREPTLEACRAVSAGIQGYDVEYRLQNKAGEYRWIRDTGDVTKRADGSTHLFIGTIIDITEKKEKERLIREKLEAQEALRVARNEMEEVLEGSRTGIWSIQLDDGCEPRMYIDRTMRMLLGVEENITPEECYKSWFSNIEQDYVPIVLETVQEIRREGRSEVTYPWNHPEMGRIYVRCGGVLDRKYRNPGICINGYHQDITETMVTRQKQEKEILDALVEAKRANRAKTEFLSHMSHDIRTPINGIMGMLAIAEKNEGDPARQKECREKIRISAEHLLSLINDVLDISKLESGRFSFTKDPFDLRELLENCVSILRSQAEGQGIVLKNTVGNLEHTALVGSPLHIRQILINIIGNAIKYNRPGGSVFVRTEELSCEDGTARFRFEVEDTGKGIGKKFLEHIFEPFMQEHNNGRTEYKGVGLGMSITKKLVDKMGGTIEVESELGRGSIFRVVLPLQVDVEGRIRQAAVEEEDTAADISGMQVLLAEDNHINCEIVQYMLEDAGAKVTIAQDGQQAVDAFAASEDGAFDCILMDVMMPVMNGLEAARIIRGLKKKDAASIPIVALSANAFEEDVRAAQEAGMNAHLSKPVDLKKLFQVLGKIKTK